MKEAKLDRPGFMFLGSYYDAVRDLPSETAKWMFTEGIIRYGLFGEEPDFSGSNEAAPYLNSMWRLLVPNLNKSLTNYQNRVDKSKTERKHIESETKQERKGIESGKEKEMKKEKEKVLLNDGEGLL